MTIDKLDAYGLPDISQLECFANKLFGDYGTAESVPADNGTVQDVTSAAAFDSVTAYDYPVSSPYNGGAGESLPYAEEFAQQAYTAPAPYTPSFTASEPVAYSPSVVSHKEADTVQTQTAAQGQPKSSGIIVGTKSLDAIRADFPILQEKINGFDLVWFDNGATTQRPIQVIA